MRELQPQEVSSISGADVESHPSPETDNVGYQNYPLRVYIKSRALYGALSLGLLMMPGGKVSTAAGVTLGTMLGMGYGYLEWYLWQ